MALMMVAMASAALAVPPESRETGCRGGQINAAHAVDGPTEALYGAPQPITRLGKMAMFLTRRKLGRLLGPRTTLGFENDASNNTNDTSNCDRD